MSELRPYFVPPSAPLTAGARFIRGFKRIGVVVAALAFLGGMAITLMISIDQQSSAQRRFEQASCVAQLLRENRPFKMKSYDKTKIDYDDSGCPGYSFYGDPLDVVLSAAKAGPPASLEYAIQPFFIGLAITLATSASSFGFLWLIGWLCAGFTRD